MKALRLYFVPKYCCNLSSIPGESCNYTYDDAGNILSVKRGSITTTYAYDGIGQLTRVNDPNDTAGGSSGTTWVYEYDRGGNMTAKKRYAYTTGTLGTVQQTVSYTYGDSNWKDKLTAYNGQTFTYDTIGNVKTAEGWTYTWNRGRQLVSIRRAQQGQRDTRSITSTITTRGDA